MPFYADGSDIIFIFSKFYMFLKHKKQLKNLREVKIKHLADYYLFLDTDLRLSFGKIMSIRTALHIPLQLVLHKDILIAPGLKLILKGIKGRKAPVRVDPIKWNLPKVLDYSRSKPFHLRKHYRKRNYSLKHYFSWQWRQVKEPAR